MPSIVFQVFQEKIVNEVIKMVTITEGRSGFVCFDSLPPSQQFLSYFGTSLPGLNQY